MTAPSRSRIRRRRVAALLAVVAAIAAARDDQLPASSPSTATWAPAPAPVDVRRGERRPALLTVRGVANLDRDLVRALRRAATDAANHGIELHVKSGWRSPAHQEQLFREAVARYGSAQEAARWVATPATSSHVSGDAVDVGPSAATAWLSAHGAAYGLCQIYANEPWHYELRPEARVEGCPSMYPDPTHDPRMRR